MEMCITGYGTMENPIHSLWKSMTLLTDSIYSYFIKEKLEMPCKNRPSFCKNGAACYALLYDKIFCQ